MANNLDGEIDNDDFFQMDADIPSLVSSLSDSFMEPGFHILTKKLEFCLMLMKTKLRLKYFLNLLMNTLFQC